MNLNESMLDIAVESYNENNAHSGYFQLELDFNVDILESNQSTVYTPNLPK